MTHHPTTRRRRLATRAAGWGMRLSPKAVGIAMMLMALAALPGRADNAEGPHSRFAWGADIGSTVDVSGHDMSTINLDAFFGWSGPWLEFAGVGAGIHMMISNSCRTFPVYAMLRSSFRRRPGLLFAEVRCGPAFNSMNSGPMRTRLWVSPAIGVHLATGAKFSSWMTIGYSYNDLRWYGVPPDDITLLSGGMSGVDVRIGITF